MVKEKVNLSNKAYDITKRVVQVGLPAAGSAYFALAAIWGLPAAEQVVGTLAVIATFLGLVLGFSSSNYEFAPGDIRYDGQMIVSENPEGTEVLTFDMDEDPAGLKAQDTVTFKVTPSSDI